MDTLKKIVLFFACAVIATICIIVLFGAFSASDEAGSWDFPDLNFMSRYLLAAVAGFAIAFAGRYRESKLLEWTGTVIGVVSLALLAILDGDVIKVLIREVGSWELPSIDSRYQYGLVIVFGVALLILGVILKSKLLQWTGIVVAVAGATLLVVLESDIIPAVTQKMKSWDFSGFDISNEYLWGVVIGIALLVFGAILKSKSVERTGVVVAVAAGALLWLQHEGLDPRSLLGPAHKKVVAEVKLQSSVRIPHCEKEEPALIFVPSKMGVRWPSSWPLETDQSWKGKLDKHPGPGKVTDGDTVKLCSKDTDYVGMKMPLRWVRL